MSEKFLYVPHVFKHAFDKFAIHDLDHAVMEKFSRKFSSYCYVNYLKDVIFVIIKGCYFCDHI